jgi:hypothetical protein
LLELAIDAETRVLATPGNFADAVKWLIELDPEQVLPDPFDTPEAHENAMKHRRRTQAPHVRKLLAAWDKVTHKAPTVAAILVERAKGKRANRD